MLNYVYVNAIKPLHIHTSTNANAIDADIFLFDKIPLEIFYFFLFIFERKLQRKITLIMEHALVNHVMKPNRKLRPV